VNAAIPAMSPEASYDFAESVRSPKDESVGLADKIDILGL